MPFQKGQIANPTGRKRGKISLTDWVKAELNKKTEGEANVFRIATKLIQMASNGDSQAIKLIWDRIEGPVSQKIEHSGELKQTILAPDLADKLDSILKQARKTQ